MILFFIFFSITLIILYHTSFILISFCDVQIFIQNYCKITISQRRMKNGIRVKERVRGLMQNKNEKWHEDGLGECDSKREGIRIERK